VAPEQALKAAYYRNTIVHFFITTAIAEMAVVATTEDQPAKIESFWDEVWALRDMLKFEFFFAEREAFRTEIAEDLDDHAPGWRETLTSGDRASVLRAIRPNAAHWVLRPILESYLLVADGLVDADYRRDVDTKTLVKTCLALGEQYRLQKRITSAEAISTVVFEHAISLADNRGLLKGGGPERLTEREAFAAEIRHRVERVAEVERIAREGR
jgi:glycerol-3-phosphate O-acyltransferase